MRWGPFALRIGAVAMELLVAAILVLSILPLATGGLRSTPRKERRPSRCRTAY